MRTCTICKRKILDTESCWRDHAKRFHCNDCDDKMRGKHDNLGGTDESEGSGVGRGSNAGAASDVTVEDG